MAWTGHLVKSSYLPSTLADMNEPQQYLVSSSGQMSLPAAVRKRWHLENGGPVLVRDLGFAVMVRPADGVAELLNRLLPADTYAEMVRNIDDPDLRTT